MQIVTDKAGWGSAIAGQGSFDFYHTFECHALHNNGEPRLFVFENGSKRLCLLMFAISLFHLDFKFQLHALLLIFKAKISPSYMKSTNPASMLSSSSFLPKRARFINYLLSLQPDYG